jgi:CRP-like cAMP-binding protein
MHNGLSEKAVRLRRTSPFSALGNGALERVAALADEVAVPSGYLLVYSGQWRDEVYVIADGKAAVIVDGRAELTLGPGSVIGSATLPGPVTPRTAVVACTPLRFFVLERRAFDSVAADHRRPGERSR